MITVSAYYVPGDRDIHTNGLRIAVCNVLQDTAFQLALDPRYVRLGEERVAVVVELPSRHPAVKAFFDRLAARGVVPAFHCEILHESGADFTLLDGCGVLSFNRYASSFRTGLPVQETASAESP